MPDRLRAASTDGIDTSSLPDGLQSAFRQAVASAMWRRAVPDSFLNALFGKDARLRFYYRQEDGQGNLTPEQVFNEAFPENVGLQDGADVQFIMSAGRGASLMNAIFLEKARR